MAAPKKKYENLCDDLYNLDYAYSVIVDIDKYQIGVDEREDLEMAQASILNAVKRRCKVLNEED